jgi:hypothetical protein
MVTHLLKFSFTFLNYLSTCLIHVQCVGKMEKENGRFTVYSGRIVDPYLTCSHFLTHCDRSGIVNNTLIKLSLFTFINLICKYNEISS